MVWNYSCSILYNPSLRGLKEYFIGKMDDFNLIRRNLPIEVARASA
jgi:hypothetical protein